jgi:parvulin-like peptidyl-prolyl isomerase
LIHARASLSGRVRYVLGIALASVLLLSGCSAADSNSANESGSETLANFEGGEVTRSEFNEQAEAVAQQGAAQQGGEAPQLPSEGDPQYEQLVNQVMPQLVQTEVAKAYAEENGITVSEEDVNQEIQTLKQQIGEQARSQGQQDTSNDEAFDQALEQAGFGEQELRQDIRDQLPLQKVQEEVAGDAGPSDEEVRTYYDENEESFAQPAERCASHILLPPDAQDQAEEVKQRLEDGDDFAALAEELSQDPGSADQGGELGCAPETDPQTGQQTYAPAFSDALFADDAEEGDLLGPVETEFGYHIIRVNEIREASTQSFDEVEGQIQDQLTQQARSTKFQEWLQNEVESRNVEYKEGFEPEGPTVETAPSGGETTGGGS